jgi:two-component system phosphate regulon sensor histidine kinase PhoR
VVVNLVSNAIIYSRPGSEVHIGTAHDENSVIVTVKDAGIGIDGEDLPHIFERFYRSVRARQHEERGTGLGLAIVKEMIDLHGGQIEVESVVEAGTTFTVRLPLTRP